MSGDSGSVVRPRPGRAFFAPAVRLSRLGSDGNAAGEILTDLAGDVIQVEVTLLAQGIATYSVALNDAYLTTRADRARDDSLRRTETSAATTVLAGGEPTWPRFKYNALRDLAFGMRLRIDMRYFPPDTEGTVAQRSAQAGWVPMIAGPIADMRFTFGDDGARLEISGQDDLARLQDKQPKRFNFDRTAEMSLVRQALQRGGFAASAIAPPALDPPPFMTDDGNGLQEQIQAGQSLYEFVDKFAKKLDFELFMDFESLDAPSSPLQIHFEPCRSRRPPDQDDVFTLEYGKNLIEFRPTFKVRDQYSTVTVRGRHRDPQIPEEVRGQASGGIVADELFPAAGEDLTPAPRVRDRFFPKRPNEPSRPNGGNLDSDRAQAEAEAALRKMARELLTIEATTIGAPRLRPGQHVLVQGLRAPFDGYFYVTQTKHTLNDAGYRTQISGCRPGMEIPAGAWSPS